VERRHEGLRKRQRATLVWAQWEFVRTLTLFFAGLGGVIYEMLFVHPADPGLLVIFGAMMGIPIFLSRNGKNGDSK